MNSYEPIMSGQAYDIAQMVYHGADARGAVPRALDQGTEDVVSGSSERVTPQVRSETT